MDDCNLYGAGLIYGENLIYSDWCRVLGYDFGIDLFDSTTTLPLSGFYWSLYRRDTTLPNNGIITTDHILVDSGQSMQDMLQIRLDDYSLRHNSTDYLITASMLSNATSASDMSSVYIKYYHTDYVLNESNCPYLQNSISINRCSISGGSIEIEPNRWQLISIPVQYGYWDINTHKHIHDDVTPAQIYNYVVQQIEDIYSVPANTMVEVFNTYIGDDNKYYNFLTGVTDPLSIHNFNLAYQDGIHLEYTGFWVKSIHTVPFTIVWGTP